jgi:hypothetical protein
MGPRLVPLVIVAAILGFVGASAGTALAPEYPRLWNASVGLVILGGITPLIYAVNARIVPVFSRRDWQRPELMKAAMILALASGWLTFLGRAGGWGFIEATGLTAALAGGLAFMVSIVSLFRSPVTERPSPPPPFEEQRTIDKVAIQFTRLAGIWLIIGLVVGLMMVIWTPSFGRWELVWAHAMLLGWFLSMASGVSYHVLSRWTGQQWRWPRLPGIHLRLVQLGLPVMLLALALDTQWLFFVAGPIQTIALLLYVANVLPQARHLPTIPRIGVTAAAWMLVIGATLGAGFALDPVNHVTLRFTHAQTNLFGWAGLLVCGVGYYLFPRFAGYALAWPRLAKIQMAVLVISVVANATIWWWFISRDAGIQPWLIGTGLLITLSIATYGAIIGKTFFAASPTSVGSSVQLQRNRTTQLMRSRV